MTDIDIDVADRGLALSGLRHVKAVAIKDVKRNTHVTGVYFQDIPVDPLDTMSALDYKTTAPALGYFKVDVLNLTFLRTVKNGGHLDRLIATEPVWSLFEDRGVVKLLNHVNEHFDILQIIKPSCIIDLAVVIALIRPGKRYLLHKPRSVIDAEIWLPCGSYYYKKPHAVAYALGVVAQLNLLCEE